MSPKKWWHYLLLIFLVGSFVVAAFTVMAVSIIYPNLPSLESLTNYQPKQPLKVYSADGALLGEFGEERRAYIKVADVPAQLKKAVIAIEDRRFYSHHGVDIKGILRAIRNNVSGRSHEGASTITMQVAKNFFSPPDTKRDIITKIKETLLAIKIEKQLEKDEILALYLNQIYLGQRSYGFSAASQVYYAKPLKELNLAETAFLAGLPKAPSGYNPYNSKKKVRGLKRQQEVLRDMKRYGFISQAQYDEAKNFELVFKRAKKPKKLSAGYVSEIVRNSLYQQYGDEIYRTGMHVYTTIKQKNQQAANAAVVHGVINYELRHGFRGPEKNIAINQDTILDEAIDLLSPFEIYNGFVPAIVTKTDKKGISVITKRGQQLDIHSKNGLRLIKRHIQNKKSKEKNVTPGAVIRVANIDGKWQVVQLPQVEASLIAINPQTGAVNALIGGFDYNRNKFNHVTQAKRQPGSCFKPFIYSAALEKGFTAASMIDDSPITISANEVGTTKRWEPHNYSHKYDGPMRVRKALTKSKNMVSIRLLQEIGPKYAQQHALKFGFNAKRIPPFLSMALGAGSATAWELAAGYATFANSGYRVSPYLISKITDSKGNIIRQAKPSAHVSKRRVIDPRNAFIMTSMMQDVIKYGTGRRALKLKRSDIAGKTGTTNDQLDTWFAGFNPNEVAIAWMGYDQPRSLGRRESGGKTALPIWIKYMEYALNKVPVSRYKKPRGVIEVKINPETGTEYNEFDIADSMMEYFYQEFPPPEPEFMVDAMEGWTMDENGVYTYDRNDGNQMIQNPMNEQDTTNSGAPVVNRNPADNSQTLPPARPQQPKVIVEPLPDRVNEPQPSKPRDPADAAVRVLNGGSL